MARKKLAGRGIKKSGVTTRKKSLKNTRKNAAKKAATPRKRKVSAIPKGYSSITPYLIINQAANAIEFYKKAFGAKEAMRMEKGGKVGHAELKIGDAKIMLSDERPEMNAHGPQSYGGSPMSIHLYVKDSDAVVAKALSLGAKLTRPVEDMFYGDRCGMIEDPYGYSWCVSTHIEDVTPAKLKKRIAELYS